MLTTSVAVPQAAVQQQKQRVQGSWQMLRPSSVKLPQSRHRVGSCGGCQWHMHYLQPLLPLHVHFPWEHAWHLLLPALGPASSRPARSGLSRAPE